MTTLGYSPPHAQDAALRARGVDRVITGPDVLTAVDASNAVRGDRVLVASMADLASTTRDAVRTIAALHRRGLVLDVLSPALSTSDANTAALIDGLYRLEPRKRAGRPSVVTPEKLSEAQALREDGMSIDAIAQRIGVSSSAIQRALATAATQ